MAMSIRRKRLLLALERLVGNECYNPHTQNRRGDAVSSEGREIRYPITFIDKAGNEEKMKYTNSSISSRIILTGHYKFGANQLHIMRALNEVLKHLEKNYELKL